MPAKTKRIKVNDDSGEGKSDASVSGDEDNCDFHRNIESLVETFFGPKENQKGKHVCLYFYNMAFFLTFLAC